LNPLTRLVFNEDDDPILNYLDEDNCRIQPEYYVPILPMVLLNGVSGIGTGWSTNIPNFNPLDVIDNIRRVMSNQEMVEMIPYYRNFRGEITKQSNDKFVVSGTALQLDDQNIEILELPVGVWTQTYKEYLEGLLQNGTIKDYREYHTEKKVNFLVTSVNKFPLKISTTITTSNMVCFTGEGKIKKYDTPLEIIKEFCHVRLRFYSDRKEYKLRIMREDLNKLENRIRFIREVINGRLVINNRPRTSIAADMDEMKFDRYDDYEYLLGMKILSLTKERIDKLNKEYEEQRREYELLCAKTVYDLWNEDLNRFVEAYVKLVEEETAEYDAEMPKKARKPIKRKLSAEMLIKEEPAKKLTKSKAPSKKDEAASAKKVKTTKASAKKSTGGKAPAASTKAAAKKPAKTPKKAVKEKSKVSLFSSRVETDSSEGDNPWDKYKVV